MARELETYRRSPLHKAECLRVIDEIIDGLDERGLNEILEGTEADVDELIEVMLEETFAVLYTGHRDIDFAPKYTERLSESVEEVLRVNNLTYFITSVLPDFQLNQHHVEWGDLVMHYKKLCVEAARGHGKCLGVDTRVRMFDGDVKRADAISVGDKLMGADGTPRLVTAVYIGDETNMCKFVAANGEEFYCNSKHIQTFDNSGKIVDIDIPTLLQMSDSERGCLNLICVDWKSGKRNFLKWNLITNTGAGKYVCITTDGDKRFLLESGIITHNSFYFSNAYIIWQLYRYRRPKTMQFSMRPTSSSSNRGFLFSFSLQQSVDLIEILKGTIESNDILAERLMPQNTKEGAWASTNITCRNGARLTGKGFGSSVRGAHPYFIVVDDGLKDNVIYSSLQRQKSIDYFHSVIMNMIIPGGQTVVVGTPFHAQDLYGDLKTKKGWFVIEYPAIFPDGRILWPQRFSYQTLMDMRNTQGNIIFSRENLCRPIVSDASIFSLDVLRQSLIRMENYCLVRNRDDFPKKFDKVVVGADFAISSAVGADYYCYTVFGVGEDGGMWLLWLEIGKGRKYDEQLQILRGINTRFRPDVMVFEANVFQQIFSEGAQDYGMPVVSHNTGTEKNDLSKGWPSIAIAMERGLFHFPIGDEWSKKIKDMIFDQLGSVAFTDNGLQSVGSHDDICSSIWLAMLGRNLQRTGSKFMFL